MNSKINNIFNWLPRFLGILGVLFLGTIPFFLIIPELKPITFGRDWLIILLTISPIILLIVTLMISWKKEIVGGIVFTLIGLILLSANLNSNEFHTRGFVLFTLPNLLAGLLFLYNWYIKKKIEKLL